jgi:ribosomal protein S4
MSNTRYKPRLKRGVFENKRFVLTTKKIKNMQKRKWKIVSKNFLTTQSLEPLIRNDLVLIENNVFDLRKSYKKGLLLKQQTSSFLGTFSKKKLRHIFSSKRGVKSVCDHIETRLDMILIRSNLAKTLYQARWCVSSGFVSVNGVSVRVHSQKLQVGDLVRLNYRQNDFFNSMVFNLPADYLEVNYNLMSVVLVGYPSLRSEKEISKLYSFFLGVDDIINFNKMN